MNFHLLLSNTKPICIYLGDRVYKTILCIFFLLSTVSIEIKYEPVQDKACLQSWNWPWIIFSQRKYFFVFDVLYYDTETVRGSNLSTEEKIIISSFTSSL